MYPHRRRVPLASRGRGKDSRIKSWQQHSDPGAEIPGKMQRECSAWDQLRTLFPAPKRANGRTSMLGLGVPIHIGFERLIVRPRRKHVFSLLGKGESANVSEISSSLIMLGLGVTLSNQILCGLLAMQCQDTLRRFLGQAVYDYSRSFLWYYATH